MRLPLARVQFLFVSALAGAAFGVVGARWLFVGSWLSLIPWSVAGLALGWWSPRAQRIRVGVVYGFALLFAFMIAGYTGAAPLAGRLPFFAIIGVAGTVYGAFVTTIGRGIREMISPEQTRPGPGAPQ